MHRFAMVIVCLLGGACSTSAPSAPAPARSGNGAVVLYEGAIQIPRAVRRRSRHDAIASQAEVAACVED